MHTKENIEFQEQCKTDESLHRVNEKIRDYLDDCCQYERCASFAERILHAQSEKLGHKHIATLRARERPAETVSENGNYEQAIIILREILEQCTLSPEDPVGIDTMRTLSWILCRKGGKENLAEAENLARTVIEGWARNSGLENQNLLKDSVELAGIMRKLGKYDEATGFIQNTLECYSK